MLKRQRAPSPPLIPFIPDDIPHSKRPRILPHILDSKGRGDIHQDNLDEENEDPDALRGEFWPRTRPVPSPSEYRSTNSKLYELHALNRHRMIFSNAYPPAILDTSSCHAPPSRVIPRPLPRHDPGDYSSSGPNDEQREEQDSDIREESQRVKERYEDTNKFDNLPFVLQSVLICNCATDFCVLPSFQGDERLVQTIYYNKGPFRPSSLSLPAPHGSQVLVHAIESRLDGCTTTFALFHYTLAHHTGLSHVLRYSRGLTKLNLFQ